jgi:hypothetical protein
MNPAPFRHSCPGGSAFPRPFACGIGVGAALIDRVASPAQIMDTVDPGTHPDVTTRRGEQVFRNRRHAVKYLPLRSPL